MLEGNVDDIRNMSSLVHYRISRHKTFTNERKRRYYLDQH